MYPTMSIIILIPDLSHQSMELLVMYMETDLLDVPWEEWINNLENELSTQMDHNFMIMLEVKTITISMVINLDSSGKWQQVLKDRINFITNRKAYNKVLHCLQSQIRCPNQSALNLWTEVRVLNIIERFFIYRKRWKWEECNITYSQMIYLYFFYFN